MCDECGCGDVDHTHEHDHDHPHGHSHPHDHPHSHDDDHQHTHDDSLVLSVREKVLSRNAELAARNRAWLAERGVTAINLISAPGTGKTFLLERTLERLQGKIGCAVITGDQQTDNDAKRLEGKGATVRQIETQSACHLEAQRVGDLFEEVIGDDTKLLFIENVGNLVCPTAFDLGEHFKVALLSVTEGEDKPVKYPSLFSLAPVAILTKIDLLPHLDFDMEACRENLRKIHPGMFVFELSAKTGDGMDAWIEYLQKLV
ncbi:MAG: hydrogenase nickel incorporation protein HypB [Kiritimatiellae bacterium]|nr:hydrogenase nickel incorporation protein HypB [Kiritimatiellia bacterium]